MALAAILVPAALGAIQIGISVSKMIKANREKEAAMDNVPAPKDDNTATKYENIYRDLSNKAATNELANSKAKIDQNRINTVNTASQVFKDPTMRFRTSTLASINANRAFMDASVQSNKTRFAYLNKASEMGLAQGTVNRRIWSDMMLLKSEQQKLYNRRQEAWGGALNAGIHNVAGAVDEYYDDKEDPDTDTETKEFDDLGDTTIDVNDDNTSTLGELFRK